MKTFYIFLLIIFLLFHQSIFASNDQTEIPIASYFWNTSVINIELQNLKLPMQFDLGDTCTSIDLFDYVFAKILAIPTHAKDCSVDIHEVKVCRQHYIISQMKIGDFVVSHIDTRVMDKMGGNIRGEENPPIKKIKEIQGIVGLGLLIKNNFGVLIDYPENKIILTKNSRVPRGVHLSQLIKIPFEPGDGVVTSALISNQPIKLLWDTGGH